MEQHGTEIFSKEQEDAGKEVADKEAVLSGKCDVVFNFIMGAFCLCLRNGGQEHYGERIGNRGGKEDEWEGNTGQDSIDA